MIGHRTISAGRMLCALAASLFLSSVAYAQLKTFHNVPYAHAERFCPPVPVEGWDRTADYSARGPQCPQTETGNSMFLAGTLEPDENCLVMSINTPSMEGKLPVVVFIHGGSHHHGSGEWEVYDASGLARDEGIVTVSISFRHGVFGYLYDESREKTSLGYEDQVAALRWIKRNIADFGGDPDNVTVTGQSAGAQDVVYLINHLEEKLFRRAIVFSAPFLLNQSEAKAAKNASKYLKILGKDPLEATADEIVAAEKSFKEQVGGGAMAFSPYGMEEYGKEIKCGVEDVVVTWQAHDGSMFVMDFKDKELKDFGTSGDMSLTSIVTNLVFRNGAAKFTRRLRKQGINALEYKFTWCPPDANWKAAHGLEIAFLYGSKEQILGYGLAGSVTPELYDEICGGFRRTVADFARTGVWNCTLGEVR